MLLLIVSGLILMGFGLSNGSSGEMFASKKQVRARLPSRQSPVPLDSFRLPDIDGRPVDLKTFKGKVLLIVNTPSMPVFMKCTSDIVTVDSRWWPFPPTISGSRSRARIRRSKDSVTPSTASFSLFSKISLTGKGWECWLG